MRLELANYQTNDVQFGSRTRWSRSAGLEIDKRELLELVRRDKLVERADVQIARPGESVRIITTRDVIEPRVKVVGDGVAYPGALGRPVATVGQGRTNRLGGMTLMSCAQQQDPRRYGLISSHRPGTAYGNFIDMSGPCAISPYASLVDVCLIIEPAGHLEPDPANRVVQSAVLRVQDYLAKTTVEEQPADIETFDLTPRPGLPGVVYIHSIVSSEAITRNPDSTMSTAVPARWISRTLPITSSTICGASSTEGSSRSNIRGSTMSARPMASTCCSPPDSEAATWSRRSRSRGKMA